MLKIAICEDAPVDREILFSRIERYWKERKKERKELQICIYTNGKDYREHWNIENEEDILLLDIEMEAVDGIQLKEFLESYHSKTRILFITEHREVMQEAFGVNVYGFLLKPVEEERLFFYLDKIIQRIHYEMEEVFINRRENRMLEIYKILWIKADGRYSKIRLQDDEIFSDQGLTEWEETLKKFSFFRIHKSYLVNFKQVSQIGEKAIFSNGDRLPISRRRRKEIKEEYKKFLIQSATGENE